MRVALNRQGTRSGSPQYYNCKELNSDNSAQQKNTPGKLSTIWMCRHSQWSPLSLFCGYKIYPVRFFFRVLFCFSLGMIKIWVPLSLKTCVELSNWFSEAFLTLLNFQAAHVRRRTHPTPQKKERKCIILQKQHSPRSSHHQASS